MAINIQVGSNPCYCRAESPQFADFLTGNDIEIIYRIEPGIMFEGTTTVGTRILSWKPLRTINPITFFEYDFRYYVIAKLERDLSSYLVPPMPEATTDEMVNNTWYTVNGGEGNSIIFNATGGTDADLTGASILRLNLDNEELIPMGSNPEDMTDNNQYTFDPTIALVSFFFTLDTRVGSKVSILYKRGLNSA